MTKHDTSKGHCIDMTFLFRDPNVLWLFISRDADRIDVYIHNTYIDGLTPGVPRATLIIILHRLLSGDGNDKLYTLCLLYLKSNIIKLEPIQDGWYPKKYSRKKPHISSIRASFVMSPVAPKPGLVFNRRPGIALFYVVMHLTSMQCHPTVFVCAVSKG